MDTSLFKIKLLRVKFSISSFRTHIRYFTVLIASILISILDSVLTYTYAKLWQYSDSLGNNNRENIDMG